MRLTSVLSTFAVILVMASCISTRHPHGEGFNHMKFLSEYDIPFNKEYQNTIVGGLSGIDYDKQKNVYYIISDDRSEKNPARFYKAKIIITKNKIDSVDFIETTLLKNREGNFYPGPSQDPFHTPDPEAIRYNPVNNSVAWSSEGERIIRNDKVVLEDPSVTETNEKGIYMDTLSLPFQMHMSKDEKGPRRNSAFEGLTFADNYKSLFVNVEEPLYNDGPRAGLHDSSGIIRIIKFDVATKTAVAQFGYKIDPVAHTPVPDEGFRINGVSEILTVGTNKLIVVERSYSTGRLGCVVKVYLADVAIAENINTLNSIENNPVRLIQKKLLINMDSLGIYIDNIEGVSFGPVLPNGHQTLLFISDNNFDPTQKTQLLLFEIE